MAHIFCVIDGMTDEQFAPAQYANLSTMRLSHRVDTCQGQPPDTLGCVLRLLGIAQPPTHLRGYVEALGAGLAVAEGDLLVRGSWYQLDDQGCISHPSMPPQLPGLPCSYVPLGSYQCLLVMPGQGGQPADIHTISPGEAVGLPAEQCCPTGSPLLAQIFQQCLGQTHCLLLWGQAVPCSVPPLEQRAALICGKGLVRGIGHLLQMDVVLVAGATGDVDTDLQTKAQVALLAAQQHPLVVLHVNGADEAAHRRNGAQKQAFLQQVDRLVLGPLLQSDHAITVAADHGTDAVTGRHLAGLQPVLVRQESSKEMHKEMQMEIQKKAGQEEGQWSRNYSS